MGLLSENKLSDLTETRGDLNGEEKATAERETKGELFMEVRNYPY